ncbi:MAG TPA: hypothetical protein VGJ64_06895 [Gemmatimonadaceae bacterium]
MKAWVLAALGVVGFIGTRATAQVPMDHAMHDSVGAQPLTWTLGAQAIALVTRASPAVANRDLTEGYLTQPMIMATLSALGDRVGLQGMVDLEGLTLERGELDAGISGEGYVDRRHPHTYLHELVATAADSFAAMRFSLAVGKGFVPFGTDDPMARPFEKYPINHHISQIVERLLATIAVRRGPALIEAARFNGDEPEYPSDFPNRGRLWDSWAGRATLLPVPGLELQASVARVKSPELAAGGGLDQRKQSVSARFEDEASDTNQLHRYALAEWARSSEYDHETRAFSFTTMLAEGELRRGRFAIAARGERTDRPEEARLADPFRTQRPATDFSILGRTRWDIVSARVSARAYQWRAVSLVPFIELARQHATALAGQAVFDPRAFYGSNTMWSTTAGLTFTAGMIHRRTGQYGAAERRMTGMSMAGTVGAAAVSETP